MARDARSSPGRGCLSFLSKLLRDRRGNTLALCAVAIFPIIGLVGGGVDLARAHTAKSRLQQACDAAALAGRRAMSGSTLSNAAKAEALKFFNFNFAQRQYGTATFTPQVTSPSAGVVRVTASTSIPTSLMKVFGFRQIAIQANCEAIHELENIDIMLVLDTTGSMNCTPSEAGTCGRQTEISTSRIVALRSAVMTLYDELKPTQSQLQAAGLRLRYGVLPYSSTVNVGFLLRDANPQNLAQKAWYWKCTSYFGSYCMSGQNDWKNISYTNGNGNGNGNGNADATAWTGCIQERKTVNTITPTTTSLPSGATDLDIDTLPSPSDDESSWSPYLPNVQQGYSSSWGSTACPVAAKHLAAMTESEMQTAVNALSALGGTYHDIGMIWGARMIASSGVFGSRNPTTYAGFPVRKHIIFMTDGEMCPNAAAYSAYGVEYLQKRVTGTQSQQQNCTPSTYGNYNKIHNKRFEFACQKAAATGASIWVVAFSTNMTPELQACAGAGQALYASNQTELERQFRTIARSIGALRVSK